MHLFNKTRFGLFVEYNQNRIYFVDSNHVFLATRNVKSWIFRITKLIITVTTAYAIIFITEPAKSVMKINFPTIHDLITPNGVIIYGNPTAQQFFFYVVNRTRTFDAIPKKRSIFLKNINYL